MNQLHFTINLNKYGELKQQIEAENKTFVKMIVTFLLLSVILYGFALYLNSNMKKNMRIGITILIASNKNLKILVQVQIIYLQKT